VTGEPLYLDEHDPDAMDDRAEQLRAELDRLDVAKAAARTEALAAVAGAAAAERRATEHLAAVVGEARAYGATWRDVAAAIPCTVSNAWQRWAK
jgi:hypothetical protein